MNVAEQADMDRMKRGMCRAFDAVVADLGGDPFSASSVATLLAIREIITMSLEQSPEYATAPQTLIAILAGLSVVIDSADRAEVVKGVMELKCTTEQERVVRERSESND